MDSLAKTHINNSSGLQSTTWEWFIFPHRHLQHITCLDDYNMVMRACGKYVQTPFNQNMCRLKVLSRWPLRKFRSGQRRRYTSEDTRPLRTSSCFCTVSISQSIESPVKLNPPSLPKLTEQHQETKDGQPTELDTTSWPAIFTRCTGKEEHMRYWRGIIWSSRYERTYETRPQSHLLREPSSHRRCLCQVLPKRYTHHK